MAPPQERKTGSVSIGGETNVKGEFSAIVKIKIEDGFKLGDLSEKIGQLSVLGGDLELKYSSVGLTNAKLAVNFLHWKLPELGPLLTTVVVRGAYNYAKDNWSQSEGLEARIKNTYVKGLEVRLGIDYKVENKQQNGQNVQTQGVITSASVTYSF